MQACDVLQFSPTFFDSKWASYLAFVQFCGKQKGAVPNMPRIWIATLGMIFAVSTFTSGQQKPRVQLWALWNP